MSHTDVMLQIIKDRRGGGGANSLNLLGEGSKGGERVIKKGSQMDQRDTLSAAVFYLIHSSVQTNVFCQVLCGLVCYHFTACPIVTPTVVGSMGVFMRGQLCKEYEKLNGVGVLCISC